MARASGPTAVGLRNHHDHYDRGSVHHQLLTRPLKRGLPSARTTARKAHCPNRCEDVASAISENSPILCRFRFWCCLSALGETGRPEVDQPSASTAQQSHVVDIRRSRLDQRPSHADRRAWGELDSAKRDRAIVIGPATSSIRTCWPDRLTLRCPRTVRSEIRLVPCV